MTRDRMKEKIVDIMDENLIEYVGVDNLYEVAEIIMKLWDQGFVYELPRNETRS